MLESGFSTGTIRQSRLPWAIWFIVTSILILAFVTSIAVTVGLHQSYERQIERAPVLTQIAQHLDLGLNEMDDAIALSQDGQNPWHGLTLLREEFSLFSDKMASMQLYLETSNGFVLPDLQSLYEKEREFLSAYERLIYLPDDELLPHITAIQTDLKDLIQARTRYLFDAATNVVLLFSVNETEGVLSGLFRQQAGVRIITFALGLSVALALPLPLVFGRRRRRVEYLGRMVQSILENTHEALVLVDQNARIAEIGGATEQLFKQSIDELRGRSVAVLFQSELPPEETERNTKNLFTNRPDWVKQSRRLELNGKCKDGRTFPLEVGFSFIFDDRKTEYLLLTVSDLSDQAEREMSLMQARNEALQAERAKSRFLSSISHDMRTPLNGLLASLDLMRETTQLSERQNALALIIERCGDEALEQVENVLEMTRLDKLSGASVKYEPFEPVKVIRQLVEDARSKAAVNGNKLEFETTFPENILLEGSPALFRQVVHNLLSNGLKFTSEGVVVVRLSGSAEAAGSSVELIVSVSDTGIGIEPDDLNRIFQSFETVRDSYSHLSLGSGLGLSIVKHSADLLGGKVSVESELGLGSSFSFRVTLERSASGIDEDIEAGGPKVVKKSSGLNVLVVEDNEINREMLTDMLGSRGHFVEQAVDGIEGVAKGRETAFDLILMDISLPKLDGIGATRMLRQSGQSQFSPIVAVTAHAQPEHTAEFLEAGMDRVLTKPLRMNTLDKLFTDLTGVKFEDDVAQTLNHSIVDTAVKVDTLDTMTETKERPVAETLIDNETFDALLDLLGGDSVVGYLDQFATDAETMLPLYIDAIKSGDIAAARSEAHRCAGGAAVIGALAAHEALQDMTHLADDGKTDQCLELAAGLPDLVKGCLDAMKQRIA